MEYSKVKLLITILDVVLREFTSFNEIGDDSVGYYFHRD